MKILNRATLDNILLLSRIQDHTAIGQPVLRALLLVMKLQPIQQEFFFRTAVTEVGSVVRQIRNTINGPLVKFVLPRQTGKRIQLEAGRQLHVIVRNSGPRCGRLYRFPIRRGPSRGIRRDELRRSEFMLVYSTEHETLVRLQNYVQPASLASPFEQLSRQLRALRALHAAFLFPRLQHNRHCALFKTNYGSLCYGSSILRYSARCQC